MGIQQRRRRAYKLVVAAVGFQVAIDEGNDFVVIAQLQNVVRGLHADARSRVGPDWSVRMPSCMTPMRDANGSGKSEALPVRGRNARVRTPKVQCVIGIAHQLDAWRRRAGVDVPGHYAVNLACQGGRQVFELTGKVLEGEKEFMVSCLSVNHRMSTGCQGGVKSSR